MGQCNCGRKWTGMRECHCSGCHQQFKSEAAFNKHRPGKGPVRKCLTRPEMEAIGMHWDTEKKSWTGEKMPEGFVYGSKSASI